MVCKSVVTNTILQLVTRRTMWHRELHLRICQRIGSARYAEPARTNSKKFNTRK